MPPSSHEPVRQPGSDERFYFVMTDRFANGDTANDEGGLDGRPPRRPASTRPTRASTTAATSRACASNLDYIEGLGTTAIWLTPSFKNRPVQGAGANASAGYHGYWITDFTQIDPHLGTNAELEALIDEAHAAGIKVYFDIITNHTADVIDYAEGTVRLRRPGDRALHGRRRRRIRPGRLRGHGDPLPRARPGDELPLHAGRRPRPTPTSRSRPGSTTPRSTTTAATRRGRASPSRTATSSASTTS